MATNKNIKINLDYSEFSGGITECNRKMGLLNETFKLQQAQLGNNASQVDQLTLKESKLQQQLQLELNVLNQYKERWEAVSQSENATAAEIDKAELAMTKQATKVQQTTNELNAVIDALEGTSNAEKGVSDNTNNASNNFGNMLTSVINTVAAISMFISACEQLAQSIMELATASTQWADELTTLSSQTGIATETLQELAYAAEFVDVPLETMQSSMSKLTKTMGEAQNGSASAQQAFQSLGVSITNADGSLKSSEQVFYEVIDALGGISNQAERDTASMQIFGKSAQELNSLIEQGSGSLRAYGEEAKNLGIIMSEDDVEALSNMQDSFDRLDAVMEASSTRVSAAFAPAFVGLADAIAGVDPAILDMVTGVGKVIGILGELAPILQGAAQITNTLAVAKNTMAIASVVAAGGETTLAGAAGAATAALLPQIALIGVLVIAVTALVVLIVELANSFKEMKEAADAAGASTQDILNVMSDVTFGTNKSGIVNNGSKGYALGGRTQGGRVWVGEQGAELVDLPYGATVYNHEESSQMATSNNVFNVTIDAKSVDDFNKVVNVFSGLSQSMNRGGKVNG